MSSKNSYTFELPKTSHSAIIKVIGVGGGGSNAVTNMYNRGIKDVDFVICNTDAQALEGSPVINKLQIGINLTKGLGAGANPEMGKNAAIESKEEIRALLEDGTKMLFVTAGMGGGTGTGAAPIIANVAQKMGILTVGIVTLPFAFEGNKKKIRAQEGIRELRKYCDTVLVILNDKLSEKLGDLSIGTAFAQADTILTTGAKSIAEIITVPGYVNVDFEDIKAVIKNAGAAVMGSGIAEGENRAINAAKEALTSPLLDYKDIHGAQKILLSIISGIESELQMSELTQITDYIQQQVGVDAELIFGHGCDEQLGEQVRVTVIATGFKKNENRNSRDNFEIYNKPYSKKTTKTKEVTVPGQKDLFENIKVANSLQNRTIDCKNTDKVEYEIVSEQMKIPAFLRKNVNLNPVSIQHSSEIIKLCDSEDKI